MPPPIEVASLRPRPTARVILLDPEHRVLLMRARPPSDQQGPSVWFLIGGGAEPGERLAETAAREIVEETGLRDARLGPAVWYSEAVLRDEHAQPMHMQEHYFVAYTQGGALSREGWQAIEHALVDELRWWTREELAAARAPIYPEGLAELLEDVLAGRFPAEPLVIRTLEGPVRPLPRVQPGG